jgi:glycolate oxidase
MAKRRFIGMEIGPEGLAVLRRIKQAFDPKNILNPHKVLPGDGRENSEKGG